MKNNHWWLWVCVLLLGAMACNISGNGEEETPTSIPNTPLASPPLMPTATITATSNTNNPTPNGTTSVVATATPPDQPFFVTITNPLAGARVPVTGFKVEGLQRGSFENNVLVQIRNSADQVVSEVSITSVGPLGETGTWQVQLNPDDSLAGQAGKIYAYYTSARDGSEQANYWINVTFTAN